MKPEIDVKNGMPPARAWAYTPDGRAGPGDVGSAASARAAREKRSTSKTQRPAAIRVTHRYDAPPARVFDAWLDPGVARRWLFATASRPMAHVEIDARAGGAFCFVDRRDDETARYTGEYVEIVPHHRLVFKLSLENRPHVVTRVTVEIALLKKGCELTVTHENVPRSHAEPMEGRWTGILYGLGVTLDSAVPAVPHDQEGT
jgi:uncharacterized protein YndB with AHSA1/START domain